MAISTGAHRPAGRGWARALGLLALGAVALAAGACAPRPAIQVVPAPAPAPLVSGEAERLFVVPAGTFAAELRGEPAFALPDRIRLRAGQSITIRNEDRAMHYFFDAPIAPGQSLRKTFNQPGVFGYQPGLSCSLAREGGVTIEVAP